ncbi:MAG TPA: hypothetical protein DEO88_10675 [Syntrophobacteraceae bacterium]|nr:hypothetical protein [Syntrophobacteraceae bacterium]
MERNCSGFDWSQLKKEMEQVWRQIPKPFRSERSIQATLQACLYHWLHRRGYVVVADYLPPRIQDRPVDIIALNAQHELCCAICIDTVVTLAAVKSLSSFEAQEKLILTTGLMEKKVQESRFFLKPGIEHIHLRPFDHPA